MKKILFIGIFFFGLSACKKQETVPTFGQQVAIQIQKSLQGAGVTGSVVYIGTTFITGSAAISFNEDLMIIDQNRYNLNRLISYHITIGQGGNYIEFYF
jgi:hypothetical protein